MPRGNKNNSYRARGRSYSRGGGGGRGGPNHSVSATAAASPAPRHAYPHTSAEVDVVVQQWRESSIASGPGANGGRNMNRGNGPWRGGTPKSRPGAWTPTRGTDSSRRGASTPRGRGRGRGCGRGRGADDGPGGGFSATRRPHFGVGGKAKTMIGKDAPLSDLLYSERPLLRPVKFVRATLTPFLFQHSEDMLKPAIEVTDTTETSHVPTADRVARLFQRSGTATGSGSDSDSEPEDHAQDALEELDFADMSQIRAAVDAIVQGSMTATMDRDAHEDEGDIEEVDFADLGEMRAKVDAAEPRAPSQDDIQETFTGVYNQIKDRTQVSGTVDVVNDDQPSGVQQTPPPPTLPTPDDLLHLKPSNEISTPSNHASLTRDQDTIVIEEEFSNGMLNMPVEEPSLSTTPETDLVILPIDDVPLIPDTPSHDNDNPNPLFVIDTVPTRPFTGNSVSDVVLVDRTGHGEMLGEDSDEELIVYVAPHPRSRYTSESLSPVSAVPRVKLPQTSMLTWRSVNAEVGGLRSPVREDDNGNGLAMIDNREGARVELGPGTGEEYQLSLASLTLVPATSASPAPPSRTRTNAALRARKKEVRLKRQRQRQKKQSLLGFGAYGAMMSEARLREEDARERRHPKWGTRRRGDSDVDWGTDDDDDEDEDGDENGEREEDGDGVDDEVDAVSGDLGEMEIDPDLEIDVDAMRGFLKSMSTEGSRFVTMDDIEDETRMRREDEEGLGGPDGSSDSGSSDGEVEVDEEEEEEEEAFNVEEQILIAESEGDEELSEDSDDEDDGLSPRSSFQSRLRKLREQSRGKHPNIAHEMSDEEDGAHEILPRTRSANDEEFIARINDLLDENSQILSGRDRKQKNAIFRNLHQGYVGEWNVETYLDDPEHTTPVNKKKKGKGKQATTGHFNAELEAQWAKDRAKKAAYKREREAARMLSALDPLSASYGSGNGSGSGKGRISRKAMRAAARLDAEAALAMVPRAVVDVVSLEAQMRRFAEGRQDFDDDDGDWAGNGNGKSNGAGRKSMALPPMDRCMRKMVHEMAVVFGVKSVSKGKGTGRYTTLIRTSRTGLGVNEDKVRALMRRYGGRGKGGAGRAGKGGQIPRHREGDEVGKEAPKIGESNVGFRMLASMGWSEGDRIGSTASVGIETPLTAIIKNTKLGLGATR